MASLAPLPGLVAPRVLSPDERRIAHLIDAALLEMQAAGRHAVRIVDIGCRSGATLIRALVRARGLGFVAIEGRGVDLSGDDVMIARWATRTWRDPAIGVAFEAGDILDALAQEEDASVDILLCARDALERLPIFARRAAAGEIRRIADRLLLKGAHR
ncbi:hypothetical protein [Sphingomonas sp. MMS24-J13]|uniref:hypothetical protein n=1 Tax=Sphingomonas sp. MMS24-J13 TaxID=3238686 RepID=UPI003851535E